MNANLDNTPDRFIMMPVHMPVEEEDKVLIDERRKREAIK